MKSKFDNGNLVLFPESAAEGLSMGAMMERIGRDYDVEYAEVDGAACIVLAVKQRPGPRAGTRTRKKAEKPSEAEPEAPEPPHSEPEPLPEPGIPPADDATGQTYIEEPRNSLFLHGGPARPGKSHVSDRR